MLRSPCRAVLRRAVQSPRLTGHTPRVEEAGIPFSRTFLPPTPPSNFQRLGAVSCVPWGGREMESPPPGWKPAPDRQLRHHTVTTRLHAAVVGETRGCALLRSPAYEKQNVTLSAFRVSTLGLKGPAQSLLCQGYSSGPMPHVEGIILPHPSPHSLPPGQSLSMPGPSLH